MIHYGTDLLGVRGFLTAFEHGANAAPSPDVRKGFAFPAISFKNYRGYASVKAEAKPPKINRLANRKGRAFPHIHVAKPQIPDFDAANEKTNLFADTYFASDYDHKLFS